MKNKNKTHNELYYHIRGENKMLYKRWCGMIARCGDKKQKAYKNVKCHPDWLGQNGFVAFYDELGNPPKKHYQLDRINPFGDYAPGNVRWVTKTENMNNMRVHVKGNGQYKKLAIKNGINTRTYYKRVWRGWDKKDAATIKPVLGFRYTYKK
jgi:hypothetical protein